MSDFVEAYNAYKDVCLKYGVEPVDEDSFREFYEKPFHSVQALLGTVHHFDPFLF